MIRILMDEKINHACLPAGRETRRALSDTEKFSVLLRVLYASVGRFNFFN